MIKITQKIIKRLFITTEIIKSYFPHPIKSILFSNHPGLKPEIEKCFKYTPYKIAFGEFSSDSILSHDLIVPLTIEDLKYLNNCPNLIGDNAIPIPSVASITICDDKALLNSYLIENGYSYLIPKLEGPKKYPYILKRKVDYSGKNSHIIYDDQEELKFSALLKDSEYFSQSFIQGQYEYATHILFKNQKITSSMNIEYFFESETPIKGKNRPLSMSTCTCPYLDLFADILTLIEFEGLCCFNYKVYDNQPFLIEINPRFGSSLAPYFLSFINHLKPYQKELLSEIVNE
jgi:predicted ATP-grasp superfamily ATP-dependent carboligase